MANLERLLGGDEPTSPFYDAVKATSAVVALGPSMGSAAQEPLK
jgi:hypothetical protein